MEKESSYDELYQLLSKAGQYFVEATRTASAKPIEVDKDLIICGMGGSGISGDYIKTLNNDIGKKNIVVNKNYLIPKFVDKNWNAVVISYSGNTEETLSSFHQLHNLGISPVCISSGGKLIDLAKKHQLRFIKIQEGIQPRAAFPLLFGSLFGLVANSIGINIPDIAMEDRIKESSKIKIKDDLDRLCEQMIDKFPIILHPESLSCVGTRFRCQLNENAKFPGASFTAPEFSHNAIVGFDGLRGNEQALLILRSNDEYERTSYHLNFLNSLENAGLIHEFNVYSSSKLEELLKFTWILDYVSISLAEQQGVDPIGVPSIDKLKHDLKSK